MELVILAGGKGTRLGRTDVPKAMVEAAGKPILQWTIEWAARSGFSAVTIVTHHLAHQISDWFGDGSEHGLPIRYLIEQEPMGTAGAARLLRGTITDRFMVVYGDLLCDFDAERMIAFDAGDDAVATIMVHPNSHPYDSDLVEAGPDHVITAMHPKPHAPGRSYQNLVNAAVFILAPEVLDRIPAGTPCDFGRELFPRLVADGERLRAYATFEYVADMGTPERLARVERDLRSGRVERRHRRFRQRAIFLDRDGVLNEDADRIVRPDDLVLYPGAAAAVRAINASDYLAILVTNQPGIAKGFLTEADLAGIHRKLDWELARGGAFLDGAYHCPHHPERGFEGEVRELKVPCECRKPAPGLLRRAAVDFNLALEECWMLGDREVDIEAARRVGARGVLVAPGEDLVPVITSILEHTTTT
jgi:mannose-1-phosphate guanylyltransferase / phosphomannomutase